MARNTQRLHQRVQAVEDAAQWAVMATLTEEECDSIVLPDCRWARARRVGPGRGLDELTPSEREVVSAGGMIADLDAPELDESSLRIDERGDRYDRVSGAFVASAREWQIRQDVWRRLGIPHTRTGAVE